MRILMMTMIAFSYSYAFGQAPARYSVIITEIFPDPDPRIGLPTSEFIELKNNGTDSINLRNWTLSNGSATGKITADVFIEPRGFVILTASSSLLAYRSFGKSCPVTPFPSLSNTGDTLFLLSPQGQVIHAMYWDKSAYADPVKANGGWSLEIIDDEKPCIGPENWTASKDPAGGTPGKVNSVRSQIRDTSVPYATTLYARDSQTLIVEWSEPLPQNTGPLYKVNGLGLAGTPEAPFYNRVILDLPSPLRSGQYVMVDIPRVADCQGNHSVPSQRKTGLFSDPAASDLVINEILFDPPLNGADYLEIYNRSGKIIDLGKVYMYARKPNGSTSPPIRCSIQSFPIMPDSFMVFTQDRPWLSATYSVPVTAIMVCELPTLPDEEGSIVFSSSNGIIIDELHYDQSWHHPLISDPRGVALERISAWEPTQQKTNWQSASSLTHYGTPGKMNSQSANTPSQNDPFTLNTRLISPFPDGRDDFLLMRYHLDSPGFLATIQAYDISGRPVASIANNELCGTAGQFLWYGINPYGLPLPTGNYFIHARFVSVSGKIISYKRVVSIWN